MDRTGKNNENRQRAPLGREQLGPIEAPVIRTVINSVDFSLGAMYPLLGANNVQPFRKVSVPAQVHHFAEPLDVAQIAANAFRPRTSFVPAQPQFESAAPAAQPEWQPAAPAEPVAEASQPVAAANQAIDPAIMERELSPEGPDTALELHKEDYSQPLYVEAMLDDEAVRRAAAIQDAQRLVAEAHSQQDAEDVYA
jgi:hypothetical protein